MSLRKFEIGPREIGFWNLVRDYRLERSFSQGKLATLSGIPQSRLSRAERFGSRVPEREQVLQLANTFGLDDSETQIFLATAGYCWTQRFYDAIVEFDVVGPDQDQYQGFTRKELLWVAKESLETIRELDNTVPVGAPL